MLGGQTVIEIFPDVGPSRGKMGIGLRIFLVNDDDSIRTLPVARYERLHKGERFPEYTGKRVRCAQVGVEFYRRKPLGIVWTNFHILQFDSDGRIDFAEMEKQNRLATEAHPLLPEETMSQLRYS